VQAVLREDRPYDLRDVNGRPVTPEEARAIIAEHYKVPEEVRKRNTRRARKKRREERMERQQQKGRLMFPRESGLEIKRDPVCGIIPFSEGYDVEREKAVQP